MKKITYIISNIDKALAFEWITQYIDKSKFRLSFILLNSKGSALQDFLTQNQVECYFVQLTSKKDYLFAFWKLVFLLKKINSDTIHTHLRDADLLGQLAGFLLRVPKRIYTRHSSSLHHEYHPQAVKYDKLVNYLCTDIVSISNATTSVLIKKENVDYNKIHLIHHGFDLAAFNNVLPEKVAALQRKYVTMHKYPVIGLISRYVEWKGYDYSIPAFEKLLQKYPNAHLVLANADGTYKTKIRSMLERLPSTAYTEIRFESDLFSLYKIFDIFVHVPLNSEIEAFGQIYIEALASKIPSIFTKSGIGNDICEHLENCLVVDYKNIDQIYEAMCQLIENKLLAKHISENGEKTVQKFDLKSYMQKLENLYK